VNYLLFEDPDIKKILEHYRIIWALGHAGSLMSWDMETYMPEEGVQERALASREISLLSQKLLLDEKFVELVEKASVKENLNEYERGVVRVLERRIRIYKKLPPELVGELAKTRVEAQNVWKNARAKNDFSMFKPYLEKAFELARKVAEYLEYDDEPYDALIDLYEEDMRTKMVVQMFDSIIPELKKALDKVLNEENSLYPRTHPLEERKYVREEIEKLNRRILDTLGFPWSRGRLDVSPHPFTDDLGIKDVRITTRYEGFDFKRTVYATIHEFGHALYELQVDERFMATPLAGGVSLGIHESQSRFWENIIGRTMAFVKILSKLIEEASPSLGKIGIEELYSYVNTVKPSLIRVEADELTYNFHILLRFNLERMLLNKEINVDELPEYWNNMMDEYLGIKPKTFSEGVLQDIHWSGIMIGYFPTYSLGNVIAAQIRHYLQKDLGELSEVIMEEKLKLIKEWLKEKIHKYGSLYKPQELLEKSFGEPMNPEYFKEYINEKFVAKKIV